MDSTSIRLRNGPHRWGNDRRDKGGRCNCVRIREHEIRYDNQYVYESHRLPRAMKSNRTVTITMSTTKEKSEPRHSAT